MLFIYKFKKIGDLKKNIWLIAASILVFLLSLIPVYRLYRYDAGAVRLSTVEIKSPAQFIGNYFSHFSPAFLFTKGDTNPRSQIPGHGELYWIDLVLIVFGLLFIVKNKKFYNYLPVLMILLAFIPAALTRESPHALRSILAVPGFVIISTFGVAELMHLVKKHRAFVWGSVVLVYLLFFGLYARDFFTNYSSQTAADWQYQYKQIFTEQKSGRVTDQYAQPYIFALFYQKISPAEFRSTVKYNPVDKWGFSTVAAFDGFQFR